MSTDPEAPPALDEFERLVDEHVTPHLARLGYARIGAYENERSSRAPLVAAGRPARHRLLGRLSRRQHLTGEPDQLAMGYEALDEQAVAHLFPRDPASGDEVWVYLDLPSGSLDLALGMRLPDLVERHGAPGDDLVILSPEQPLAARLAFAAQARAASAAHQGGLKRDDKAQFETLTDVAPETVDATLARFGIDTLIHGHTHRPAIHDLSVGGRACRRIVLGDWYEQGSVLRVEPDGMALEQLR